MVVIYDLNEGGVRGVKRRFRSLFHSSLSFCGSFSMRDGCGGFFFHFLFIYFFFLKLSGVRGEERHIRSGAINTDHEMAMAWEEGRSQGCVAVMVRR